jgi:acetylornithine deacetylase/succinyl-diaminopimelate desuccinylase-like protein
MVCTGNISPHDYVHIFPETDACIPGMLFFETTRQEKSMLPDSTSSFIDQNRERFVRELSRFLAIPSVSTLSEHKQDIAHAAQWVLEHLERSGISGRIYQTEGHPVVLARSPEIPGAPVLLIYGHYDVQPPDPLDEWKTPPFSPDIRDGFIYARGATDDKGQLFTYLKAIEALLGSGEKLPLNLSFLVEGEEEITSPNLEKFLKEHKDELRADAVAISDGSQFAHGIPAITYGLRGLCYLQLDIQGPRFDLHSGSFGGILDNPVQVLADILAKLKNPDGTVAIPGFYDDVLPLADWERQEMASLPIDEEAVKNYLGISQFAGEPGYSLIERKSSRPTLDINGIWGGFSGEGSKTIIPAKAGAKVSMRLVPNQTAEKIHRCFREFITTGLAPGVKVKITGLHGGDPVLVSRQSPAILAAERAIEVGFGKKPVFIREGGSIPVVDLIKKELHQENILLLGWGSPDDGAHSPNERFSLEDFYRGIRSIAALFHELSAG